MGTADTENPIPTKSTKRLQTPTDNKKKTHFKKSPTPRIGSAGRDSSSMTPTRSGRSLTPFSLYLIRHSTDPADPPKWRSITPFIDRKDKEKTPFELGRDLKAQLIAHKMVFDRASVMDITDDSNYEPGRYITSDAAVLDRASVMDISNVEVVYLIEEYDEAQEAAAAAAEEELQKKEKKKAKRVKKIRSESVDKTSDTIEKEVSSADGAGNVEKKITKSKKKSVEKKKKIKNDSDDDLSPPPPSPPKLTLKLEMGAGSKMNKKMFEKKSSQPEPKPPVKKSKQELEKEKANEETNATAPTDNKNKIKKKKKSIISLGDGDNVSIKSESKKSKSRTASIAESIANSIESVNTSEGSPNDEEDVNSELQSAAGEDNQLDVEEEDIQQEDEKVKTPTPSPPTPPPRRSPSPAFPPKQPESYYKKLTKQFDENFSNQIRMFNSVKRAKPHHPGFMVKLKDLCVTETDNIRITAAIYGPNISYKWFKDGIIMHPNDRINFIEDENILTLEIVDSRPKDTADYTLKIFNEYKMIECVSYVNVAEMGGYQDEPCPAYIESLEDYFHFIDDKLMIECKVQGTPRPQLTWYKEDMEIHEWMTEYTFMEEPHGRYILIVNHPTEQDIGNYTLHVENDRGSDIRKHCVQFLAKRPTTSSKLDYRAWNFLC